MRRVLALLLLAVASCSPEDPDRIQPGETMTVPRALMRTWKLMVVGTGPTEPVKVGGQVDVVFRLKNGGTEPVWVLGSLDGSDGGRSPRCVLSILDEQGLVQVPQPPQDCGFMNPLVAGDFRLLKPGHVLEAPLVHRTHWWRPSKAGTYAVQLTYDTTETALAAWAGSAISLSARTRELLPLVPKGHVVSDVVTIKVVP